MREFVEIAFERAGLDPEKHVVSRPALPASGGGRPAGRRRVEGAARARLGAADVLPRAGRADGRRRPRAGRERAGVGEPVLTESRWRVPLADMLVGDELIEAVLDVVRSGWWSMGPRVEELEHGVRRRSGRAARDRGRERDGRAAPRAARRRLRAGRRGHRARRSTSSPRRTRSCTPAPSRSSATSSAPATSTSTRDLEAARHASGRRRSSPRTTAASRAHERGARGSPTGTDSPWSRTRRTRRARRYEGRPCGTIGAAGCFSFFSNKNLPVGEGGMIVTDDDELAARCACCARTG